MTDIKEQIFENLQRVQKNIRDQALKTGRDASDVHLVAVSKKQPLERVRALLESGHRLYGENRIQEAMERWDPLKEEFPDIKLHLIGPLQTNKVKEAVSLFDVIETVDRPKLVTALSEEMEKQGKKIPCFIQVNTGAEPQKSGVLPEELQDLLKLCLQEKIQVAGLMCIPPIDEPPALHFAFLQKLAEEHNLPDLSMGMSSDFEKAIPLNATYIRVGTALFGSRQ